MSGRKPEEDVNWCYHPDYGNAYEHRNTLLVSVKRVSQNIVKKLFNFRVLDRASTMCDARAISWKEYLRIAVSEGILKTAACFPIIIYYKCKNFFHIWFPSCLGNKIWILFVAIRHRMIFLSRFFLMVYYTHGQVLNFISGGEPNEWMPQEVLAQRP